MNIDLSCKDLPELPSFPKILDGYFWCADNYLTSLKGCPKIINSSFDCSHNKLVNLLESPKVVFGKRWHTFNHLLSRDYIPFNNI
jgi:hypothetical protein